MKFLILALALSQTPAPVPPAPAPTPSVGKEERPAPPVWVEIKADPILTVLTAPTGSKWSLLDDGADLVSLPDGRAVFGYATKPGRYRATASTPTAEVLRVVVIVGDLPKPPVPVPPSPPEPPVPTDPLIAKLKLAYDLDTRAAAKKNLDLLDLVELYKQAADLAGKPDVGTVAALIERVRMASKILIVEGLTDLRKVIAGELGAAFPVDAPLDEPARAKAKAAFLKISEALKAVK
jgi:hypothetical protein